MRTQFQIAVTLDGNRLIIDLPDGFINTLRKPGRIHQGKSTNTPSATGEAEQLSEREFVLQKRPRGHAETTAVLAFCLRESGLEEFTADDIRRCYIRAAVRPPKVVAQALRDAKNKYDLIESGSKRSTFRLSAHGERTVLFDLPRSTANS